MGRKRETTSKESLITGITPSWHKTTVRDLDTGKTGVGRDYNKGKSISKAYKDLREK